MRSNFYSITSILFILSQAALGANAFADGVPTATSSDHEAQQGASTGSLPSTGTQVNAYPIQTSTGVYGEAGISGFVGNNNRSGVSVQGSIHYPVYAVPAGRTLDGGYGSPVTVDSGMLKLNLGLDSKLDFNFDGTNGSPSLDRAVINGPSLSLYSRKTKVYDKDLSILKHVSIEAQIPREKLEALVNASKDSKTLVTFDFEAEKEKLVAANPVNLEQQLMQLRDKANHESDAAKLQSARDTQRLNGEIVDIYSEQVRKQFPTMPEENVLKIANKMLEDSIRMFKSDKDKSKMTTISYHTYGDDEVVYLPPHPSSTHEINLGVIQPFANYDKPNGTFDVGGRISLINLNGHLSFEVDGVPMDFCYEFAPGLFLSAFKTPTTDNVVGVTVDSMIPAGGMEGKASLCYGVKLGELGYLRDTFTVTGVGHQGFLETAGANGQSYKYGNNSVTIENDLSLKVADSPVSVGYALRVDSNNENPNGGDPIVHQHNFGAKVTY